MRLSQYVQRVQPSATMAIDGKAKAMKAAGQDVVSFGPGEPDFDTPDVIKQAAKAALDAGYTKYTAVAGAPELREAIRARYKSVYGIEYAAEQTIATNGGKQALLQILQATLDPGDEVIVLAPYWVSYPEMVKLAGAEPVIVTADESTDFLVPADKIRAAVTDKTRALIINSPSNPTGCVYDRSALQAIADLAVEKDFFVIADEIYEQIVYEGAEFACFATLDGDLADRVVIVSGLSKSYAMTGWRVGYAVGPKSLIGAMSKLQSQSTSNICSIAQKAAVAALQSDPAIVAPMVKAFARRRELIVRLLDGIPHVTCYKPKGAFYVFPKMNAYYGKSKGDRVIAGSMDLSGYLLDEALVATVPGAAFGSDANIRLSYALSDADIERGIERIAKALGELS